MSPIFPRLLFWPCLYKNFLIHKLQYWFIPENHTTPKEEIKEPPNPTPFGCPNIFTINYRNVFSPPSEWQKFPPWGIIRTSFLKWPTTDSHFICERRTLARAMGIHPPRTFFLLCFRISLHFLLQLLVLKLQGNNWLVVPALVPPDQKTNRVGVIQWGGHQHHHGKKVQSVEFISENGWNIL